MSDTEIQEPNVQDEAPEGTEAEAGTVAAGHTFTEGDEATVIRGKLRGRKGKILKHNAANKTYAIELDGGDLAVVNAGNLKAPADSTVSVSAIVAALVAFPDREAATALAMALDSTVPGVSVKLHEATAV